MNIKNLGLLFCIAGVTLLMGCTANNNQAAVNVSVVKAKTPVSATDNLYVGAVQAGDKMQVLPNIGGKVIAVNVELGQNVEKDAVLFQIDNTDYILQLKQSQASYEAAKANYEKTAGGAAQQTELQLKQAVEKAQNELNDAQIAYNTAKTSYDSKIDITPLQLAFDDATANYERIRQLNEAGAESAVNLENAKSKMDTTKAQLDSMKNTVQTGFDNVSSRLKNAETALNAANENLNITVTKVTPENIKNAKAQLENARVSIEIAQKKISDTSVKAPMAGIVSAKNIKTGDLASPQASAMELINANIVEIPIEVTETTIGSVKMGMKANVLIQGTGETVAATVAEISPTSNATTGMFLVKLSANNSDGKLKEGMNVTARFSNDEEQKYSSIPEGAVVTEEGKQFVFLAKDGKAVKTEVSIGTPKDGYVEILSNLDKDALLILQGIEDVVDNAVIQIMEN